LCVALRSARLLHPRQDFGVSLLDALAAQAWFIGFTGTPIESGDKHTQAVFGDLGGVPNTCQFVSL
jgi:hypothetical protein